jgi:hypothetical protein
MSSSASSSSSNLALETGALTRGKDIELTNSTTSVTNKATTSTFAGSRGQIDRAGCDTTISRFVDDNSSCSSRRQRRATTSIVSVSVVSVSVVGTVLMDAPILHLDRIINGVPSIDWTIYWYVIQVANIAIASWTAVTTTTAININNDTNEQRQE